MTDKQTPPDWVLLEAAKRCGGNYHLANLHHLHRDNTAFRALCDMIERYEQPPMDPLVEALIETFPRANGAVEMAKDLRAKEECLKAEKRIGCKMKIMRVTYVEETVW